MKRRYILYCAFIAATLAAFAFVLNSQKVDFAYPQEVIAQADSLDRVASKLPSEEADFVRLEALLMRQHAVNMIDGRDVTRLLDVVNEADGGMQTAVGRGIVSLLRAKILCGIYNSNSWNFDKRTTPAEPLPANPLEWNGRQFGREVATYINKALAESASPLYDIPAAQVGDILEYDKNNPAFPTLRSAVEYVAYSTAQSMPLDSLCSEIAARAVVQAPEFSAGWFYWKSIKLSDKPLLDFYLANRSHPEAAMLLLNYADRSAYDDLVPPTVRLIRENLAEFPDGRFAPELRNRLASLTSPTVKLASDAVVCPGRAFEVRVNYSWCKSVGIDIYFAGDDRTGWSRRSPILKLRADADAEAWQADTAFEINLTRPGLYVLRPVADGKADKDTWAQFVTCTEFVPILFSGTATQAVVAASTVDGAPVGGVGVRRENGSKSSSEIGTTAGSGILPLKLRQPTQLAFYYRGKKQPFSSSMSVYPHSDYTAKSGYNCQWMTDLPVYRPGQTVAWAAIVERNKSVAADVSVKVTFLDVNGTRVDEAVLTTDRFGRIHGSFAVPSDRLTGSYTLKMNIDGRDFGYYSVMVSDYRMPTFRVEQLEYQRDVPSAGCVRISGRATTFSGMPVADAAVNVAIFRATWWRYSSGENLGDVSATTDAQGRFEVVVPEEITKDGKDRFKANVVVTSKANEAAVATLYFSLGKPYRMRLNVPERINADVPVAKIVEADDAQGRSVAIEAEWSLLAVPDSAVVASGRLITGEDSLDFSRIPVGNYILKVLPADPALAEPLFAPVSLYSIARNEVPPTDGFFIISDGDITADESGKGRWRIGVSQPTHAYVARCAGSELLSVEHVLLPAGFTEIEATIPRAYSKMSIRIATVTQGNTLQHGVALSRPDTRRVYLKGESMRDRLVPGGRQTWRLKFSDYRDLGIEGAMVATLYNESLNSVANMMWPSGMSYPSVQPSLVVRTYQNWPINNQFTVEPTYERVVPLEWPALRYTDNNYGPTIFMAGSAMTNRRLYKSAAVMESAVEDCLAVNCEAEEAASDAGEPEDKAFDFRPVDVAGAFWMPDLTIAADGSTVLTFSVPDANTTWALRAFAWTADKRAASLEQSFLANRPLMVQPTLPRFLRQGDSATLTATVFNNSDHTLRVTAEFEIFDPLTGVVLRSATQLMPVEADASALVKVLVDAPTDLACVGCRVKASAEGFTDGEQGLVSILDAATTVVESQTFYLDAGSPDISLTLPNDSGMVSVLQYCQNPVWNVVKAMRGLPAKALTATDAANALFASVMASRIDEICPAVGRTLRAWKADSASNVLESMLARNADLKLLDLDNTPWLQTSQNQSARMQALDEVFNPAKIASNIALSAKSLSEFQTSEGGFCWGGWDSKPSRWATKNVLITMALAHSLGAKEPTSDQVLPMLRRAWEWYQSVAEESDCDLALIPALMPELKLDSKCNKLVTNIVAKTKKNWKKHSTSQKAWDAIVLNAHGQKAEALKVLASIRQFGVAVPGKGLTFPSVTDIRTYATIIQAFAMIDPVQSELDAMRQWVVLRQQANDDFGANSPDYIIASLLLTGTDWTSVDSPASLSIAGREIVPVAPDVASGYFAMTIPAADCGSVLRIATTGRTPSYGSVTSIGRQPIDLVEPFDGPDLKIRKQLLVERDGAWVEPAEILAGERVRVVFTLTVGADMEYVTLTDSRAAALEPVDQLSRYTAMGGLWAYVEPALSSTQMFFSCLPKGVWQFSYDCTAMFPGTFASGPATIQSQYAPEFTARSSSRRLQIR